MKDAVSLLRDLVQLAPKSLSAKETLAQACALLSQTLLEVDDTADDESKVWEGQIGSLAREALALLEEVAGDKMDRMRQLRRDTAAQHAPAMAETFMALSTTALTVSHLATDLTTVDTHIELAEQALDQASSMATIAASSRSKSSTTSSNLITRVQLASGASSIERLRHTFLLGVELDEDDFRALISDIKILAGTCRERAATLKGSRSAAATTLAWEASKQLGDAKLTYANLLRMVWRRRKQARKSWPHVHGHGHLLPQDRRKMSRVSDGSAPEAIMEEDEGEEGNNGWNTSHTGLISGTASGTHTPSSTPEQTKSILRKSSHTLLDAFSFRRSSGPDHFPSHHSEGGRRSAPGSPGPGATRKGSAPVLKSDDSSPGDGTSSKPGTPKKTSTPLGAIRDGTEVSSFVGRSSAGGSRGTGSFVMPMPSPRRGSWLPTHGESSAQSNRQRNRRLSSMSAPLVEADGQTAWSRKGSIIALAADETAEGLVPSSLLAQTAWDLLDSAVKQYKVALSLVSSTDMPHSDMAKAKTETLYSIAYCSLFMASLAPRLSIAHDKRTSLLVTAEVYSTWAAREVGWSFLIEGTKESQLADRRTNSWRADESGKRAVMLLLRTWWFRAVTTETIDVDTKVAAKDAVETVVRRMKDKEGVREGDIMRYRNVLTRWEGELDGAEGLFWRSVSRILRGGNGFVMS